MKLLPLFEHDAPSMQKLELIRNTYQKQQGKLLRIIDVYVNNDTVVLRYIAYVSTQKEATEILKQMDTIKAEIEEMFDVKVTYWGG